MKYDMKMPNEFTDMNEHDSKAVGGIGSGAKATFDKYGGVKSIKYRGCLNEKVLSQNPFYRNVECLELYEGTFENGHTLQKEVFETKIKLTTTGKVCVGLGVAGAICGLGYLGYELFFDDD